MTKEPQVVPRLKGLNPPRQFIRQWRKFRNLTQEQLAERIEMSPGNLSNIETDKQPVDIRQLAALAYALRCEVVDLLIRNPLEPESIWTLWERAKPAERQQIVELAKVVLRTAA